MSVWSMPHSPEKRRIRKVLWEKQGRRCYWCREQLRLKQATLDHMVPASLGGSHAMSNLVVACEPCNNRRGDQAAEDFAKTVVTLPKLSASLNLLARRLKEL